jgi:hypothetical protein
MGISEGLSELEPFINGNDDVKKCSCCGKTFKPTCRIILLHTILISLYTLVFILLNTRKSKEFLLLSDGEDFAFTAGKTLV